MGHVAGRTMAPILPKGFFGNLFVRFFISATGHSNVQYALLHIAHVEVSEITALDVHDLDQSIVALRFAQRLDLPWNNIATIRIIVRSNIVRGLCSATF